MPKGYDSGQDVPAQERLLGVYTPECRGFRLVTGEYRSLLVRRVLAHPSAFLAEWKFTSKLLQGILVGSWTLRNIGWLLELLEFWSRPRSSRILVTITVPERDLPPEGRTSPARAGYMSRCVYAPTSLSVYESALIYAKGSVLYNKSSRLVKF